MKGNCEQGKKKTEECEDDEEEISDPSLVGSKLKDERSLHPTKEENIARLLSMSVDDDETGPKLCSVEVAPLGAPLINPSVDRTKFVMHEPTLNSKKSNVETVSRWEIGNEPIEPISHRRSRTAIEVSGRSIQEIADIIFDMNKARSIHASYHMATVKCKTRKHMKFSIKLSKSSKDANVVVVDVRRLAGCALKFRVEYVAIAQAISPNEVIPLKSHGLNPFPGIISMDSMEAPGDDIIKDSLEMARSNLKSEVYDARIIAFEDLLLTTGSESEQTSSTACNLIMGEYNDILVHVVGDIMRKVQTSVDDDDDSEEFQRSLSLNILANLLDSVNDTQTLGSFIEREHIETLVWYVDKAREHPWNACLAVKCLRLLAPYVNAQHYSDGVYSALNDARSYGEIRYNLLEEETTHAQVLYS